MKDVLLPIKPLTANRLWAGRRFKTKQYDAYRDELLYLLPPIADFPEAPFAVTYEFGIAATQDLDNCLKGFNDALQIKYGFNDSEIHHMNLTKCIAKHGKEYIKFKIEHFVHNP